MAERHSSSARDSLAARIPQDTRRVIAARHRELKAAIDVGNRASHGESVCWHEVSWLLGVVRTTTMSHPLPGWFEEIAAAG